MKGKILVITIISIMIVGSFGAVGTQTVNDCGCNDTETENGSITTSSYQTGLVLPLNWEKSHDGFHDDMTGSDLQDPPSSFSWKDESNLPPVRDQGNCGSCWAFGTVGPLECRLWMDGIEEDLSEQYLVSCNKDGWGCNGGWFAHKYHTSTPGTSGGVGAVLETDYPYTSGSSGNTGSCQGPVDHYYKLRDSDGSNGAWAYIGNSGSVPSVEKMKKAIYNYGPISVAVAVDSGFQAYNGGVFKDTGYTRVNHAVVLVGYDDSEGYWILRNSWGSGWGENGYMRIEYGANKVGYAACYIDDYEELLTGEPRVDLEIDYVDNTGKDDIEWNPLGDVRPEWYLDVHFRNNDNENWNKEHLDNKLSTDDPENPGFWIWDWVSEHKWEVNRLYQFEVTEAKVEFRIRLCDDDKISADDLAGLDGPGVDDDVSWSNKGAILNFEYDLATDTLSGDVTGNAGSYITSESNGNNGAKIRFKITDTYDAEKYRPKLSVDPSSSLDFGDVVKGNSKTLDIEVTNTAREDPLDSNGNLEWQASITSGNSWIDISPTSQQSLGPGQSKSLSVTVSTSELSADDHDGRVKIESDNTAGQKTYNVYISVNVVRSRLPGFTQGPLFELLSFLRTHLSPIFSQFDLVYL